LRRILGENDSLEITPGQLCWHDRGRHDIDLSTFLRESAVWSVVAGTLPPGLTLPKRENTISGTPTTAGTFTFTVRITDDLDPFSEKELSITIS
jgi:hypothetical protein